VCFGDTVPSTVPSTKQVIGTNGDNGLPDRIWPQDLDHQIAQFTSTGGLSRYRDLNRNWDILADPAPADIAVLLDCRSEADLR
jgi:hypothetical protein